MAKITTLIFDLDGTLYRSQELAGVIQRESILYLAGQLELQPDEMEKRLVRVKRDITARSGWEATLSSACIELGADIRGLHRYLAENVAPEPFLHKDERVIAMLNRLSSDYCLYIYTNNNRHLALRIMTAIGTESCFRKIFSIEDFWRSKPDKKAIETMLADMGVTPPDCLFIGDRYDVDLRLPAELGGSTFQSSSVEELLELEEYLKNTL